MQEVKYKLVPVEPTDEMIEAAHEKCGHIAEGFGSDHAAHYRAMLAAAPEQLSDLEIVQKAVIEKCGRAGCVVFHTGGWVVEIDEYVIAEGNNNESLLTWAKQTIEGVE